MASNDFEDNVTRRLRDILRANNFSVETQVKIENGRIDLLVEFEHFRVAIECEHDKVNAEQCALRDATSRLSPIPHVHMSIALIYPPNCKEVTLDKTSTVRIARIEQHTIDQYSKGVFSDVKKIARQVSKHIEWNRCSIDEFLIILNTLPQEMGKPDNLVKNLKSALSAAEQSLPENSCKTIARALNLDASNGSWRPAAKRSFLVIVAASMFHARLEPHLNKLGRPSTDARTNKKYVGVWPPPTLNDCVKADNAVVSLSESWSCILAVDYRPIFEAGCTVLESLNTPQFLNAVKIVVNWARLATGQVEILRHDILGRIFHILLENARYDGSYYTSVPAAMLLSTLALPNSDLVPVDLNDFKIIDPACGTGTLLMSTAERLRHITGANYDAKLMLESVLTGIDINLTALHLAATTLGLLTPTTEFKNLDIRMAPFGRIGKGSAAAGSLELYGLDSILPYLGLIDEQAAKQIETNEQRASHDYRGTFDLVIMNPPFTRNDLRHRQLPDDVKKILKKREKQIFSRAPIKVSRVNSGLMFLILGEHLCKKTSTFASVFPTAFATAPSAEDTRKFLAKKFHINYIVTPHDPQRFYFSENTDISETLIVMTRKDEETNKRTHVVSLIENPDTPNDAIMVANDILHRRSTHKMARTSISRSDILDGDWSRILFLSPSLHDVFLSIRNGELFTSTTLGKVATIHDSRKFRDVFKKSQVPSELSRRSIYGNNTRLLVTIKNRPNTLVAPKTGQDRHVTKVWNQRSALLLPDSIQPNNAHVTAVYSTVPTMGAKWATVVPHTKNKHESLCWKQSMSLYLNSTLGVLTMLSVRIPRKPLFPRFSTASYHNMPIPVLSSQQLIKMTKLFNVYSDQPLDIWSRPGDETKISIDADVCEILGVNNELVNEVRSELSTEPMCTGQRYSSLPWSQGNDK